MPIQRLLIGHRGEIAVRSSARAGHGDPTIQAQFRAIRNMLAGRLADEVWCIGPAQATQSYLNWDAIVAAAQEPPGRCSASRLRLLAENAVLCARL